MNAQVHHRLCRTISESRLSDTIRILLRCNRRLVICLPFQAKEDSSSGASTASRQHCLADSAPFYSSGASTPSRQHRLPDSGPFYSSNASTPSRQHRLPDLAPFDSSGASTAPRQHRLPDTTPADSSSAESVQRFSSWWHQPRNNSNLVSNLFLVTEIRHAVCTTDAPCYWKHPLSYFHFLTGLGEP